MYSTVLQYGGFVVLEARNGAEALHLTPNQMRDAIVTELTLAVVDGCVLLQRFKQHSLTGDIPFLVVTADVRPGMRKQAEEAGCNGFFTKRCSPRDLLQVVRDVVSGGYKGAVGNPAGDRDDRDGVHDGARHAPETKAAATRIGLGPCLGKARMLHLWFRYDSTPVIPSLSVLIGGGAKPRLRE